MCVIYYAPNSFSGAALSAVWAWPYSEEIVTTITAVDTFFGAVLCISTATYNKEENGNG